MKKSVKVLVVVTMVFLGFTSQAQIFGIEGAVGLANITSPNAFDDALFGRALGAKIGGTIEFDITDNFYVGSGLNFAKKGASTAGDNFSFLYVEVPIGARYEIFEIGRSNYFYASSGFQLGVMVSAMNGSTKQIINASTGNFKPLEFGVNGGLGVIFDDRFDVGLMYEFGLTDISSTNSSILKNVALMFSFGYKFGM